MNFNEFCSLEEAREEQAYLRSKALWPVPKELPQGLAPVRAFDLDLLPSGLSPWVGDIAERMQCPPDFIGVPAMVALGSLIGRKFGVRPQRKTDWLEVPNLWGCLVGRPGAMKSPAMAEALRPIHRLEAEARKAFDRNRQTYEVEQEVFKLKKEEAIKKARTAIKGEDDPSEILALRAPEKPESRRYLTNDCTYEKLGEIHAANPNGLLVIRDELVSLLQTLDGEEYAAARGFYLTGWNGTTGYTFDRIVRGQTHIDGVCLSLLGSTPPARLAEYVRRAVVGGRGDDGLLQRFGLIVWPDQSPEWKEVDEFPNSHAREEAWDVFRRLDQCTAEHVGAEKDAFGNIPSLRLTPEAYELFVDWRSGLEKRIRSGELSPAVESHLAKYRGLIPCLALIIHVADGGVGPIDSLAMLRALSWCEYLESHALRMYGAGSEAETAAAKAILARIRRAELSERFTARDVHQRGWSGLTSRDQVQAGLNLLGDLDWIAPVEIRTGGRPKTVYKINPASLIR